MSKWTIKKDFNQNLWLKRLGIKISNKLSQCNHISWITTVLVIQIQYTVSQKRVHMFHKVRKINLYLHTYWMNLDDLNCARKVWITAFWAYLKYDVIPHICWDNPIIVQLHMWTLFLLLNFMYYLLDYSTKSSSNLMKLCMRIYTYHSYVSANYQVILFIYNREI